MPGEATGSGTSRASSTEGSPHRENVRARIASDVMPESRDETALVRFDAHASPIRADAAALVWKQQKKKQNTHTTHKQRCAVKTTPTRTHARKTERRSAGAGCGVPAAD